MKHYNWRVLEGYPDGFVWKHYYTTRQYAEWAIEDMQDAHKGRTYTIEPIT